MELGHRDSGVCGGHGGAREGRGGSTGGAGHATSLQMRGRGAPWSRQRHNHQEGERRGEEGEYGKRCEKKASTCVR